MNRADKIECPCGGKYRLSDKAKHMRTKKHLLCEEQLVTLVQPEVRPVQPKVEDVLNIVKTMAVVDQNELLRQLQILLASEPEPAPEPENDDDDDTNSIQQLRTRLHKQLGEDFLLNMHLPDVEDDEYDIQVELEDKAHDMMSEKFGDDEADKLWEQFNRITEWNNRVKREEISDQYDVETFERNTSNHTAPKALMHRKNLTTIEDQYQFWITKDPQSWYDKFTDGQLINKTSDVKTKSKLVEYDYYVALGQIYVSSNQRKERTAELGKQVQQILKDNPDMECLCK